jgi:hypothetical protein
LTRILFAQRINKRGGGALVKPWELENVPEDYLTAFRALDDMTQNKEPSRHRYFEDARRKHPSYRKY